MMSIIKKVSWKQWLFWGLNLLLAGLAVVCILLSRGVTSALPTLNAAKTWAGQSGERFAQLACYLPHDQPIQEETIYTFRYNLLNKLRESSMEAPEGGSLFTDAYCGMGTLNVAGDRGSAQVKVTGVGSDFFRFHPLPLRSGSYLSDADLMKDRVILDESLAWKLFGGTDLAGMSVTIEEKSFYVAGVVARENDPYSAEAYTGGEGMFMAFSTLKELQENAGITCYEIVLPDPITGFGKNMLNDSFPVGNGIVVENSRRYTMPNLIQVVKDFGKRSMGVSGIIYPYWENAVRLTEDYAALLLVLTVLFAICPVVSILVTAIRGAIRLIHTVRVKAKTAVEARIEAQREKKWQRTAGKRD